MNPRASTVSTNEPAPTTYTYSYTAATYLRHQRRGGGAAAATPGEKECCPLTDPRLSPRVMVGEGHEDLEITEQHVRRSITPQPLALIPYAGSGSGSGSGLGPSGLSTSLLVHSFLRARISTPSGPGPGELEDPPPHRGSQTGLATPGTVDRAELHRQVRIMIIAIMITAVISKAPYLTRRLRESTPLFTSSTKVWTD